MNEQKDAAVIVCKAIPSSGRDTLNDGLWSMYSMPGAGKGTELAVQRGDRHLKRP